MYLSKNTSTPPGIPTTNSDPFVVKEAISKILMLKGCLAFSFFYADFCETFI